MKRVSLHKNNSGYTLTELIVVIAVIAILAVSSMFTVSQISSERARKCTGEITSLLAECKVNALAGARQKAYLRIYQGTDGKFYGDLYEADALVSSHELGSNITCTLVTTSASYAITTATDVCIGFDRGTGAFRPLTDFDGNDGINGQLKQLVVTGGTRSYTIDVVAATGYYGVR